MAATTRPGGATSSSSPSTTSRPRQVNWSSAVADRRHAREVADQEAPPRRHGVDPDHRPAVQSDHVGHVAHVRILVRLSGYRQPMLYVLRYRLDDMETPSIARSASSWSHTWRSGRQRAGHHGGTCTPTISTSWRSFTCSHTVSTPPSSSPRPSEARRAAPSLKGIWPAAILRFRGPGSTVNVPALSP